MIIDSIDSLERGSVLNIAYQWHKNWHFVYFIKKITRESLSNWLLIARECKRMKFYLLYVQQECCFVSPHFNDKTCKELGHVLDFFCCNHVVAKQTSVFPSKSLHIERTHFFFIFLASCNNSIIGRLTSWCYIKTKDDGQDK